MLTRSEKLMVLLLCCGALTGFALSFVFKPEVAHSAPAVQLLPEKSALPAKQTVAVSMEPEKGMAPLSSGKLKKTLKTGLEKININSAGSDQLATLPGIGPGIAGRILERRRLSGPFQSAEDLLQVKGIGPARLQKLRDRIVF